MKLISILLVTFIAISSCQNSFDTQISQCKQIKEDSLIRLNGTLNLDSKGKIIFENASKRTDCRKIELIPCSQYLNDYLIKCFNSHVYNKKFDERFWVSVDGNYLTTDTRESPQQFVFCWIALIAESEAMKTSG